MLIGFGGWAFEVAKPESVCEWLQHDFRIVGLTRRDWLGCNEFAFRRETSVERYGSC